MNEIAQLVGVLSIYFVNEMAQLVGVLSIYIVNDSLLAPLLKKNRP